MHSVMIDNLFENGVRMGFSSFLFYFIHFFLSHGTAFYIYIGCYEQGRIALNITHLLCSFRNSINIKIKKNNQNIYYKLAF